MPTSEANVRPKRFMRRLNFALWMAALFFFAGYGLTYLTRDLVNGPVVATPVAALGAMWVGARIGRPMRAAWAGMGLGAVAGLGAGMVLVTFMQQQPRQDELMLWALNTMSAITGEGLVIHPVMFAMHESTKLSPEALQEFIGKNMLAMAGFCGLAATLFGLAAQRRRQRIERQWLK